MKVKDHPSLQSIYEQSIIKLPQKIVLEPTHILHSEFQFWSSSVQAQTIQTFYHDTISTPITNIFYIFIIVTNFERLWMD